jgi:hypothetical protein
VTHVWLWFLELNRSRSSNGFGPSPIGYGDILAWGQVTGSRPAPWEIEAIKRLDNSYLKINSEQKSETQ